MRLADGHVRLRVVHLDSEQRAGIVHRHLRGGVGGGLVGVRVREFGGERAGGGGEFGGCGVCGGEVGGTRAMQVPAESATGVHRGEHGDGNGVAALEHSATEPALEGEERRGDAERPAPEGELMSESLDELTSSKLERRFRRGSLCRGGSRPLATADVVLPRALLVHPLHVFAERSLGAAVLVEEPLDGAVPQLHGIARGAAAATAASTASTASTPATASATAPPAPAVVAKASTALALARVIRSLV